MQRKKRTKSKLVKQFMNFLLAIALGISLLQLPQLSKEVKAENVNTNNGKQSQEMAGSYYLDKNRNSGKKVIAANAGLTPEDNLGPYIKYTIERHDIKRQGGGSLPSSRDGPAPPDAA